MSRTDTKPPVAARSARQAKASRPAKDAYPGNSGEGVLFSLAKVVEQRDGITAGHCERLALTAVALGVAMGLDEASLLTLYLGGFLHDIGKVGIPDAILFKAGPLTEEEWDAMRTHPARGESICRPLKSFRAVLPLIRSHHERMDGSGYPDHLRGEKIPLLARVLQTVDIYDALTNTRPYKEPCTRQRALEILEEEAACGWRDPEITSRFVGLNRRVLEKIRSYSRPAAATSMRQSLNNLQQLLAS